MKLQIPKTESLPKWAQERICDLERQRDAAVLALNQWSDNQTKSPIFIEELVGTGENTGPTVKRRYVQGYKLNIVWEGVDLEILLAKDDSQRSDGIHLQWSGQRKLGGSMVAMIPKSFQQVELVSKENMR